MTPLEYLRQGQLPQCLDALQAQVRQQPADPKLRVFLFQLLSVMGRWDRALSQLKVASEMDAKCAALGQIYEPAVLSEALRAEVFAGRRTPVIFGEPEPWMGLLVQANELTGKGEHAASQELRARALDDAPAVAGKIDGKPFEWIADADPRTGPMLELVLNGRYCWVPFHRIRSVTFEPPTDLRDTVWLPAQLRWTNGGEAVGLVPVRYPGSESADDPAVVTARKTNWISRGEGLELGMGQRLLATDDGDYPLLEVRTIQIGEQDGGEGDGAGAGGTGGATEGRDG
jgi:type VI secretion system protein ImpE